MSEKVLVILSDSIFTGTDDLPLSGFVAVRGNRVEAVGTRDEAVPYLAEADEVRDVGERTVMPGLIDVHTFYTGWALRSLGADLSCVTDIDELQARLRTWKDAHLDCVAAFGHDLPVAFAFDDENGKTEASLDAAFGDVPVVCFTHDAETCVLNAAACDRYEFTPEACYAEKIWRMMRDYLALPEVCAGYDDYIAMLNARGVTAIKEMAFDDYYGFADEMERREKAGRMSVRVSMMSQPVGAGADLPYARAARARFQGPFVRFSGFNRMTDRGVWAGLAEMVDPYESGADGGAGGKTVVEKPEWDLIERELRAIDSAGFRYSLHCQGDGAVRHTIELYDDLPKDDQGHMRHRHAITDMENSDPADLARLGALGGICEVYPQILTLDAREDCLGMMRRQIGEARLAHSWNRRGMEDAGCVVCCGTDLPLLIPSLGDAIYSACGGYFDDGLPANEGNTLTLAELLRAWTVGGAYDLMREDELGTLEAGKLADICVLDRDVFAIDYRDARDLGVALTVSDGRIVYEAEREGIDDGKEADA